MKIRLKPNKVETIILIILAVIWMAFLITDIIMLETGNRPIFSIKQGTYLDGGTTVYLGLGYKVIDYDVLDGYTGYRIGTWFMKYNSKLAYNM